MLQPKKPVKVVEKKINVKVKPKPAPPKAKGMQRVFKYNPPLKVETESAQNGKSVKKIPVKNSRINTALPGMGLPPAIPKKVETASAQNGAKVKDKTAVKVTPKKPKDFISKVKKGLSKLTMKDVKDSAETALNLYTLGGYGVAKKKVKELTGLKSGGTMKKAKSGLGMKSVKSGYDNNSGVTRADFVAIGKGTAKSGTKMKKAMSGYGGKAASMVPMKSGGKMAKCKYGCK